MSDMGDIYRAAREDEKRQKHDNLGKFRPDGWVYVTPYWFRRTVLGSVLDYWPSTRKYRWRGKTYRGQAEPFILKVESTYTQADEVLP